MLKTRNFSFRQFRFIFFFIVLFLINIFLLTLIVHKAVNPFFTAQVSKQTIPNNPLEKHYASLIDSIGAEKTYAVFKKENAQNIFRNQHSNAHIFGQVLYEKVGIKGVTVCDSSFAFGCYHSFFAKAISDKGINSIITLDKECIKKYGLKGLGCSHGIGHGVIYYLGNDHLTEALNQCTRLSWKGPVGGCTSGVFMEYNLNTMNNPTGEWKGIRPFQYEKRQEPCTKILEKFKQACYFEMPQWWVMSNGGKTEAFAKAGTYCREVADKKQRETCFMGIGNIAAPSAGYDVKKAVTLCEAIDNIQDRTICQAGASWSFLADTRYKHLSAALCNNLPEENKTRCLSLGKTFL